MHLISDPVGLVAGHVGHFGAHLLHPLIDPGNLIPGVVVVGDHGLVQVTNGVQCPILPLDREVVPWLWFPGTS